MTVDELMRELAKFDKNMKVGVPRYFLDAKGNPGSDFEHLAGVGIGYIDSQNNLEEDLEVSSLTHEKVLVIEW